MANLTQHPDESRLAGSHGRLLGLTGRFLAVCLPAFLVPVAGSMGAQERPVSEPALADPSTASPAPLDSPERSQSDGQTLEVEPVMVTPLREYRSALDTPATITSLSLDQALREASVNLADAVADQPGVFMQRSNLGGGSPVIRGRTGKDVLYLIDGQRFSNATFRRNTQYLNTIDLFAVESIEVLRGPSSVLYGSDAIAGAVQLITRRPRLRREFGFDGRTHLQFESASRSFETHVDADAGGADFAVSAGFTTRSFDDLKAGRVGDPIEAVDIHGKQDPTGYHERDFNMAAVWKLSEQDTLDYFLLYDRQYSVPTSERTIANEKQPNPSDRIREVDPQRLNWQTLRLRHVDEQAALDRFELQLSLNNPSEGRRRVSNSAPTEEILEDDDVLAPGLTTLFGVRWLDDHHLVTGAEAYYEVVDSQRRTVDRSAGTVQVDQNGRYPDDSRYRTFGVFAQDEWQVGSRSTWTNGVRYSRVEVNADFDGLVVGPLPPFGRLSESYDDVTLATGWSRRFCAFSSWYASIGRGFRAPNLDDLAILGDFSAGDRVPNFDLEQETVWNLEVGVKRESPTTSSGLTLAHARYHNLFANRFLFNQGGTDFFQVDNTSRATTWTVEGWVDHVLHVSESGISTAAFAQGAWTIGRDESFDEPLSKVPPPDARLGLRLEDLDQPRFGEVYVHGAAQQDRLSAADEADPRFPLDGTPAWWTLNARTGFELLPNVRAVIALENLFNTRYRLHGSGIDAPGRNLVLSLQWRFGSKHEKRESHVGSP